MISPDEFFTGVVQNTCEECVLYKKKLVVNKVDGNVLVKKNKPEVVIIMEMYPDKDSPNFKSFINKLDNYFQNFAVLAGVCCNTINSEIPSPVYKPYKYCNQITESSFDFSETKVIIPIGRAINAITQTSDLPSVSDFYEFQFNQTYFYTGFYWKKQIRCYPIPSLDTVIGMDNFESYFFVKQIQFIKEFLNTYTSDRSSRVKKIKIDPENVNSFIREHLNEPIMAWDTETSSLDPFDESLKIGCITCSFDGITGYYLPFNIDTVDKMLVREFLNRSESKIRITAFGKYDINCMHTVGITDIYYNEEVTLAHHLLYTDRLSNSIKSLAWLIPGFGGYDQALDNFKENNAVVSYLDIPESILFEYSVLDAIVTFKLYQNSLRLFKLQPNIVDSYRLGIEVAPAISSMEKSGINADKNKFIELESYLKDKLQGIQARFYKELGYEIKITSTEQIARAFEIAGLPDYGRSVKKCWIDDKGKEHYFYKVGKFELRKWKRNNYPLADLILEYREYSKLLTAFVGETSTFSNELKEEDAEFFDGAWDEATELSGLARLVKSYDKVHPKINIASTKSYRSSSNFHTLTKKGDFAKKIRSIFIPPSEDYTFMEFDYSGLHLRIAAIMTEDPELIYAFKELGGDLHSMTAHMLLHADEMDLNQFLKVKKQEPYNTSRNASKTINFFFLYLGQATTFANTIEDIWSDEKIDKYISDNNLLLLENPITKKISKSYTCSFDIRTKFFDKYKNLEPYYAEVHKHVKSNGSIDSHYGTRLHLPTLMKIGKNSLFHSVSNLLNSSLASSFQAFEAWLIYSSIVKIYKELKEKNLKSRLVLTIHDSIAFYAHKSEILEVFQICKRCMETDEFVVPITIGCGMGQILGFPEKEFENEEKLKKYLDEIK